MCCSKMFVFSSALAENEQHLKESQAVAEASSLESADLQEKLSCACAEIIEFKRKNDMLKSEKNAVENEVYVSYRSVYEPTDIYVSYRSVYEPSDIYVSYRSVYANLYIRPTTFIHTSHYLYTYILLETIIWISTYMYTCKHIHRYISTQ